MVQCDGGQILYSATFFMLWRCNKGSACFGEIQSWRLRLGRVGEATEVWNCLRCIVIQSLTSVATSPWNVQCCFDG